MKINNLSITNKNINDYIICIPSYKRYDMLKNKTLFVLDKHNIPLSKIYIFVANTTEDKQYKLVLDTKYHSRIIIGKKGLRNQRNFINNYFPEGKCIVELDDDLEDIVELYHPRMDIAEEWKNTSISELKSQEFKPDNPKLHL